METFDRTSGRTSFAQERETFSASPNHSDHHFKSTPLDIDPSICGVNYCTNFVMLKQKGGEHR
jgi:hypothetical protein